MYYDFLPSCALQKVLNGSSRRKSHLILFSFSVTTKFILLLGILLIAGSSQIHYNSGTGVQSGSSSFVVLAAAHSSDFSPSPPSSSSPLLTPLSSIAKHDDIAFPNTRLLVLSSSSSKGRRQLLAIPSTTSSIPQAKLCYIYFPSGRATTSTWHAHFALHEYHHRPHDTVNFTLSIIQKDRNENPTIAAKAVLEQGKDCDIFLGPRTSSYSSFVGPIAEVPMISESATSTALSDKSLFKYFSRTALADDSSAKAMTRLMHHMNITSLSIICIDDSFGKSLASQIRSNFKGKIDVDLCWSHTVSTEAILNTLNIVEARAESSVLALVMSPKEGFMERLIAGLQESRLHKKFTLLLPDSMCSGLAAESPSPNTVTTDEDHPFSGAFCALQNLGNQSEVARYTEAWGEYDKQLHLGYLTDPHGQYKLYNYSDTEVFNAPSALMADAVQLGMESVRRAVHANPTLLDTSSPASANNNKGDQQLGNNGPTLTQAERGKILLEYVHNTTISGISGQVKLDPNTGDRLYGVIDLFNVGLQGHRVPIGVYISGVGEGTINFDAAAKWTIVGKTTSTNVGATTFDADSKFDFRHVSSTVANGDSGDDAMLENLWVVVLIGGFVVMATLLGMGIVIGISIPQWSSENISNFIFSPVWVTIGGIVGRFVDCATDFLGWFVVLSRDGTPLSFIILYSILTAAGLAVSALELKRLFKYLQIHCFYSITPNGVPPHLILFWNHAIANVTVLTMVIEDIPMVVMATAAIMQETNAILLVSLSVSAVATGTKFAKVGVVLKALSQPEIILTDEVSIFEAEQTRMLAADMSVEVRLPHEEDTHSGADVMCGGGQTKQEHPTSIEVESLGKQLSSPASNGTTGMELPSGTDLPQSPPSLSVSPSLQTSSSNPFEVRANQHVAKGTTSAHSSLSGTNLEIVEDSQDLRLLVEAPSFRHPRTTLNNTSAISLLSLGSAAAGSVTSGGQQHQRPSSSSSSPHARHPTGLGSRTSLGSYGRAAASSGGGGTGDGSSATMVVAFTTGDSTVLPSLADRSTGSAQLPSLQPRAGGLKSRKASSDSPSSLSPSHHGDYLPPPQPHHHNTQTTAVPRIPRTPRVRASSRLSALAASFSSSKRVTFDDFDPSASNNSTTASKIVGGGDVLQASTLRQSESTGSGSMPSGSATLTKSVRRAGPSSSLRGSDKQKKKVHPLAASISFRTPAEILTQYVEEDLTETRQDHLKLGAADLCGKFMHDLEIDSLEFFSVIKPILEEYEGYEEEEHDCDDEPAPLDMATGAPQEESSESRDARKSGGGAKLVAALPNNSRTSATRSVSPGLRGTTPAGFGTSHDHYFHNSAELPIADIGLGYSGGGGGGGQTPQLVGSVGEEMSLSKGAAQGREAFSLNSLGSGDVLGQTMFMLPPASGSGGGTTTQTALDKQKSPNNRLPSTDNNQSPIIDEHPLPLPPSSAAGHTPTPTSATDLVGSTPRPITSVSTLTLDAPPHSIRQNPTSPLQDLPL